MRKKSSVMKNDEFKRKVSSELRELQLSVACSCTCELFVLYCFMGSLLFTKVRGECMALEPPSLRDKFLEVREDGSSPSVEENSKL